MGKTATSQTQLRGLPGSQLPASLAAGSQTAAEAGRSQYPTQRGLAQPVLTGTVQNIHGGIITRKALQTQCLWGKRGRGGRA